MSYFEKVLNIIVRKRDLLPYGPLIHVYHLPLLFCSRNFTYLKRKMPGPKRYFLNNYPVYNNEVIDIQPQEFKLKLLEYIPIIEEKQTARKEDTEGGIYVGIPGIAYMFFHLSQLPLLKNYKEDFLKKALTYISTGSKHEGSRTTSKQLGFVLGEDGIHAIASVIYNALGMKEKAESQLRIYASHAKLYKPIDFLRCGGDELFVGRAGYVSGALWLSKVLGKEAVPAKDIVEICAAICESGRNYALIHRSPCPLMFSYYDTEYLGAAHGLCSILLTLISCKQFISQAKNDEVIEIKRSVDFLLSLQTEDGNFPTAMDEIGSSRRSADDELVHWCHGAPGVVYLMAKAYQTWKDNKYLESCLKCGELVWEKGLLKKGPGICHGVAGSGYVFLLLYRLTGDPKHLYRAQQFANFLFTPEFKASRTPDCPYSLYEGIAGTACFLGDLLHPKTAAFPFMDVF